MKQLITYTIVAIMLVTSTLCAQTINWRSLNDNKKHIANANFGFGYGTIIGLGYGEKLPVKFPLVVNVEFSTPFGEDLFDDLKTKLGGQAELYSFHNFSIAVKAYGIYRQYKNEFVKLAGFGSEFSTTIGYYKPKWYVAGEFGFDKAIATHIKNSDIMKENYPGSEDGWYVPTGGNFFYGITSGYSFKTEDIYLKVGKTVTQDFKTNPTIPFYAEAGFNVRF